ncbi:MAG: hypothetical protein WB562_17835, partial [Candidatus Sulfotelmatobacter sp.]
FYQGIKDGINRQDAIDNGMKRASLYIKGCQYCVSGAQEICKHEGLEWMGVKNTPEESITKPHKATGWSHVLNTALEYCDFYKNDSWKPVEVEHVKGQLIYEDGDIRILWKAKYDLIVDTNNGLFPIDHKTMSMDRGNIDILNNQFMGQAYLLKGRSMMVNKIGFQKSYKTNEKFERVVINYTFDQLTEWSQEIVPYWARMMVMYAKNNIWPPNFQHCEHKFGRCEFYDVCSVDRSIRPNEIKQKFMRGKKWDISNVKD